MRKKLEAKDENIKVGGNLYYDQSEVTNLTW